MKEYTITVGDVLYHHTDKPVESFSPECSNVVYFGRTSESVEQVGGVGYLQLFEIIQDLGIIRRYGSREGVGLNGKWISIPAEIAAESLQHLETIIECDDD